MAIHAVMRKPGEGMTFSVAFGPGALKDWVPPSLIEPRGLGLSAQARRLLALRRNLQLLETSQSQSIWHKSDVIDADRRLREQADFVISYKAA